MAALVILFVVIMIPFTLGVSGLLGLLGLQDSYSSITPFLNIVYYISPLFNVLLYIVVAYFSLKKNKLAWKILCLILLLASFVFNYIWFSAFLPFFIHQLSMVW